MTTWRRAHELLDAIHKAVDRKDRETILLLLAEMHEEVRGPHSLPVETQNDAAEAITEILGPGATFSLGRGIPEIYGPFVWCSGDGVPMLRARTWGDLVQKVKRYKEG